MKTCLPAVASVLAFAAALSQAAAAPPTLTGMTPGACAPGQTTAVSLAGANLQTVERLWISNGQIKLIKAEEKTIACEITLPADAAGVEGVIAANPEGASDVLLAPVDAIASTPEQGSHGAPATAQPIALPAAIDGAFNASGADYYRMELEAGQRLAVDCWAARLGLDFDPVVRLLDVEGRELEYADDDESLGADLVLEHVAAAAGPVILEVRDNRYRGGGRYRLRLGDFPAATSAFPLAVEAAHEVELQAVAFHEATAKLVAAQKITAPPFAAGVTLQSAARIRDGSAAITVRAALSQLPQVAESDGAAPTELPLPCGVSGRLLQPGEVDRFRFSGVKGQTLRLRSRTLSLGSPSLLVLKLLKPDGSSLAASSPAAEEPELAAALPADGEYQLEVAELLQRGGPRHTYYIEAEWDTFGVELKHDNNAKIAWSLPAGDGAAALTLNVARHGENGPLTLTCSVPGARIYPAVIPAGAKTAAIVLAVPPDAAPGDLAALRILAAAGPRQEVTRTRQTVVAGTPSLIDPPAWLDGLLRMAVVKAADPLFTAAPKSPYAKDDKHQLSYKIALKRVHKDFKDPVRLIPLDAPEGVKVEAKLEKDVFQITVGGADKLAPDATVRVALFGQLKERGQLLELTLPTQVKIPPRPPAETVPG